MSKKDLKHDLGQLLMVGFWGSRIEDPWVQILSRQIEEGKVGGIIFYGYNIENPKQISELTTYFKSLKSPHPLLIGIDEEGGRVQRLTKQKGFSDVWGAQVVATTLDPEGAYGYYLGLAQKLSEFGFNLNFGPVVDVDSLNEQGWIGKLGRSYGNTPESIIPYARSFLRAHAQSGVLTSLKHFPGHGRALGDTHLGFVDITGTWTEDELLPFEVLIHETPFVMTAHVTHKQWGQNLPVTFSPDLLGGILREKLKFKGVIITDDLHMGAVGRILSPEDASLKALIAGNDMLLFSNNPSAAKNIPGFRPSPFWIEDVLEFLQKSDLNMDKIEASIDRILKLKESLGLIQGCFT